MKVYTTAVDPSLAHYLVERARELDVPYDYIEGNREFAQRSFFRVISTSPKILKDILKYAVDKRALFKKYGDPIQLEL